MLGRTTNNTILFRLNEVQVLATGGDLKLGGLDWNRRLEAFACEEFVKQCPLDPRFDPQSMQDLAMEVEQAKRSLSVRPKTSINVRHGGRSKLIPIEQTQFNDMTADYVKRAEEMTVDLLKRNKLGWARVNSVLVVGGASRMPMIRTMLKRLSGTTLNTELSPDQSVAQGAAFYAGMMLSGQAFKESSLNQETATRLAAIKQQNVSARALGILVRDQETGHLEACYLVPANSLLPCEFKQIVGTLVRNQRRVHLHIVESGSSPIEAPVELGFCLIQDLPPNLPEKSPVEVVIRYDAQARVRVRAKELTSGKEAQAIIVRPENVVQRNRPIVPAVTKASSVSSPRIGPARAVEINPTNGQLVSESAQAVIMPALDRPQAETLSEAKPVGVPKTATGQKLAPKSGAGKSKPESTFKPSTKAVTHAKDSADAQWLERTERPVPLCNDCGTPLSHRGDCPKCIANGKNRSNAKSNVASSDKGNKSPRPGKPGTKASSKKIAEGPARSVRRKTTPSVESTNPTEEIPAHPESEFAGDDSWG